MKPVIRVQGGAYPLGSANIDTDCIIAAEHLKTTSRTGLGAHAFAALRRGQRTVFDDPAYAGARILIAGANFGCGSSREHAVWALMDLGIAAVVAPSFSDIFAGNAFKNGLLTVAVDPSVVDRLIVVAQREPITIDLETMTITTPFQDRFEFELDPFRRICLLEGTDEIALTLAKEAAITAYETHLPTPVPRQLALDR